MVKDERFLTKSARMTAGIMLTLSGLFGTLGLYPWSSTAKIELQDTPDKLAIVQNYTTLGGGPFFPTFKSLKNSWQLAEGAKCVEDSEFSVYFTIPDSDSSTICSPLTEAEVAKARRVSPQAAKFIDDNRHKIRVVALQPLPN